MRRAQRTLSALLLGAALPGCAWLGPDAAQREILEARRARSAAMEPEAPTRKTVEQRLAEAERLLAEGHGGQAVWSYAQAHR